ncbi:hypothetical protein FVEG_17043 [Fusarium verticillioides 7600]|uniref:Uncharacterized protein n=1 Tax=Gibberella moniliformis (strain M3125 / FGSC 7600) TaxID=334819 RepID=W7MNF9_GIBM7|nr:hypothetical protein FVEG_17043 [Fusarium verticillioides 7600]EWG52963.1 hypothetical protein FVEG_17043 [Fusarium verticillioides 7600]
MENTTTPSTNQNDTSHVHLPIIVQTITKTPTNILPAKPKSTHRKISPTPHQIINIKNPPSPYVRSHELINFSDVHLT